MFRIFFLTIFLIAYGSLYPWDIHWRSLPVSPLWILLHAWPYTINRFIAKDIIVNILLYAPLGVFGYLAFAQSRWPKLRFIVPLLCGLLLSASIEMIQIFTHRNCSALDLACNFFGTAIGVSGGMIARLLLPSAIASAQQPASRRRPGALLLLACWIAYITYPLFPDFSRMKLRIKIEALLSTSTVSVVDLIASFAEFLVLAKLLEVMFGAKRARLLFPTLLLFIPFQPFITTRTVHCAELLALPLAYLTWLFFGPFLTKRSLLLAALLAFALLLRGLAPFQWQPNTMPFSWIPFRSLFISDWQAVFVVFLRKAFDYGAAVWLLREAGWRFLPAAGAIAALLGLIEAVQTYLPGRIAEITDPILALVMACILWLLEKQKSATGK